MRGALALLRLELASRARILLVAAAAGLIPPAAALSWVLGRHGPDDVRSVLALLLAGIIAGTTAVALGSSVLSRDLLEGRLGFVFSRPLSGASIWGERMLAAVLLTLGTLLLVLAPTLALTPRETFLAVVRLRSLSVFAVLTLAATILLVGCSHTLALILRVRSRWLLVDLGGALLLPVATAPLLWRLMLVNASHTAQILTAGLGASLVVAVILAGLVQTTAGRCDLARGRRLLSMTLWGAMACAALVVAAVSHLTTSVDVDEMEMVARAGSGERGDWILVGGLARSAPWLEAAPGLWLVHPTDGRSESLDVWQWWYSGPVFSSRGHLAFVSGVRQPSLAAALPELTGKAEGSGPEFLAWTVDLSGDAPALAAWPSDLVERRWLDVSPELELMALAGDGAVEVFEVDGWRRLVRIPLVGIADSARVVGRFVGDRLFLVFAETSDISCRRIEVELVGAAEVHTADLPGLSVDDIEAIDGTSGRVLVLRREVSAGATRCESPTRWELYDSTSTGLLAEIPVGPLDEPPHPPGWYPQGAFLSDGRVVVSSWSEGGLTLAVLGEDGEPLTRLLLLSEQIWDLAGEPRSGVLVFSSLRTRDCTAVDLATGRETRLAARPFEQRWRRLSPWGELPRGRAACLMASPDGSTLLELNPDTLELTPLLGPGARARP